MKRIYHNWNKWECYKSGFYNTTLDENISPDEAKNMYKDFLSNLDKFENSLNLVIGTWEYSCEHFLTNPSLNKIAWLGQASACISMGIPSKYRSGFYLLTIKQQKDANNLAYEYYLKWKEKYNHILIDGKSKDMLQEYQMRFQWN